MAKRQAVSTKTRKEAMLKAMSKHMGIVTQACKTAKVPRQTYYQWLEADEEFKKAINEISEEALDFVESQHYKNIKDGNVASTIFHLKTKGKKRGYQENLDVTTGGEKFTGFTFLPTNDPAK